MLSILADICCVLMRRDVVFILALGLCKSVAYKSTPLILGYSDIYLCTMYCGSTRALDKCHMTKRYKYVLIQFLTLLCNNRLE